jgi:deoxyribodipyrimidine photolyase
MKRVIHWFRRDLRSLAKNLAQLGGRFIICAGEPCAELERLGKETSAEAIYTNRGIDPFDVALESRVEKGARTWGIEFHRFLDVTVQAPDAVLTRSEQPFRVFTPYARAWQGVLRPAVLLKIGRLRTPAAVRSEPLPTLAHWNLQPEASIVEPGEKAARTRLKHFLDGLIFKYADRRNLPAEAANSRLSQDLRWGTLSPRQVLAAAEDLMLRSDAAQRRSISAGTGADAAPYFRIQNPWTQTKRYDPQGIYIKKWVPELRDVKPIDLMRPPDSPLVKDYPLPIVDHDRERELTVERFQRAQQISGNGGSP